MRLYIRIKIGATAQGHKGAKAQRRNGARAQWRKGFIAKLVFCR